jgi:TonB family protein
MVAAGEPLQPIKPWVVHFDDTECYAERTYGTTDKPIVLRIKPSPLGDTYEMLVAHKGAGPRYGEELQGSVDFNHGPIKAWLLRYATDDRKFTVDKFRITSAEMAQAKSSESVNFHIASQADESFALAAVADLLVTLDKCNEDLRQYWNMTEAKQKIIAAPAVGDVRSVFSSDDYPDEAFSRSQEGAAQFLLFVEEKGGVAACHVLQPSGIPALDGMGCQVIRQRAKFKPALDAKGRPIRSSVVTPPIVWKMD